MESLLLWDLEGVCGLLEENHRRTQWLGLSFSVSLGPWAVTFTATSQLLPSTLTLLRRDRKARVGYFPSPRLVRTGEIFFLRAECSVLFQNGYFSPLPAASKWGFFLSLLWEPGGIPGGKTPENMTLPPQDCASRRFSLSRQFTDQFPKMSQLHFKCFYHLKAPEVGFCSW